ncbi:MAG: 2-hydroxychromene-2-carboxylate isomerase [Archangiaceae bacterium]|nr:2-hydroxychromene-2-carboxylate isomerase [Archangiaceae bacterium]
MSPYSYLAATQVEKISQRTRAKVKWVPVYLPGIMRAVGNKGPTEFPPKAVYTFKDLNDWAKHYGLPEIVLPDPFPFQAAAAQRLCLVADEQGRGPAFALAMFHAIWGEHQNANDPQVMGHALKAAGVEAEPAVARAQGEEIRARLKANTDAAVERGAFGVPTFFVGDEMFVGNDRLIFVEKALNT